MCDSPYLSDAVHDLKGHRYSSLSGQPHELTGASRRADEEMSGTTATYRDAISSWSSRGDPHFTEGGPAGNAKECGGAVSGSSQTLPLRHSATVNGTTPAGPGIPCPLP